MWTGNVSRATPHVVLFSTILDDIHATSFESPLCGTRTFVLNLGLGGSRGRKLTSDMGVPIGIRRNDGNATCKGSHRMPLELNWV